MNIPFTMGNRNHEVIQMFQNMFAALLQTGTNGPYRVQTETRDGSTTTTITAETTTVGGEPGHQPPPPPQQQAGPQPPPPQGQQRNFIFAMGPEATDGHNNQPFLNLAQYVF